MRKKHFELLVQFGLSTLLALGIASSVAQASSNFSEIRFEAELETAKITDLGSVTSSTDGATLLIHLKNGTLKITPFDQTDKTIQIRAALYVYPDVLPNTAPASVTAPVPTSGADVNSVDISNLKPLYNSTFLTNLNMDAELREMRVDGTLLYKLKLNPRTVVLQK
jgi:hypothetical protein